MFLSGSEVGGWLVLVAGSPLDEGLLLGGGLDADGEAVAPGEEEPVTALAGEQPALEVRGQIEGVADGADGGGVLLQEELEGGVLEERPAPSGR